MNGFGMVSGTPRYGAMGRPHDARSGGFTLIEMAMVMVVASLLLSGAMLSLSVLKENSDRTDTTQRMTTIEDALNGFVITEGRLPCPAHPLAGTGEEMATTTGGAGGLIDCQWEETPGVWRTIEVGILPWATLDVPPTDAWGHYYTYHVSAKTPTGGMTLTWDVVWADDIGRETYQMSDECLGTSPPAAASIAKCTAGIINVISIGGDITGVAGGSFTETAAAVVVSHGEDAVGAFIPGGLRVQGATSASQLENSDSLSDTGSAVEVPPDRDYFRYPYNKTPGSEFDDLVIRIEPLLVQSLLIKAGKL